MSILGIGAVVGYFISGWLCDRFGMLSVITLSSFAFCLFQLVFALMPSQSPMLLMSLAIFGFGMLGVSAIQLLSLVRSYFPSELSGRAVTGVNLFGFLGIFSLQWFLGLFIRQFPSTTALNLYEAKAYRFSFLLTGLLCLAALAFFLPEWWRSRKA
ncbi:MAG: MFS transporter [Deinococcales bacterium]